VSLEVPEGQKPQGRLQPGAQVPAKFVGLDLMPPEIGQLANELRLTAEQLRESHLVEHLDETIQTVNVQLQKAGKLVDTIDNTVHDSQVQENLRASLENVRKATEQANRVGANLEKFSGRLEQMGDRFDHVAQSADTTINKAQAHIDDLAKQMTDRMEQAARLLTQVQSITAKVDGGKGTAGMLVNDPKLYEGLVDTTKELSGVLRDLKLLVEQIREEGFPLRLGK
jgi:ABC-type transporter Mla subunit MlaD